MYDTPKYTWGSAHTEQSSADRAVLSMILTLAAANVQRATQTLRFTVIRSTGWFVCDIQQAG